jgi:hypothetical protein
LSEKDFQGIITDVLVFEYFGLWGHRPRLRGLIPFCGDYIPVCGGIPVCEDTDRGETQTEVKGFSNFFKCF